MKILSRALLLTAATCLSASGLLAETRQVHVFSIDGSINDRAARRVAQAIAHAGRAKAECLLLELNTPGGELGATKAIVDHLARATVPVVAYVAPQGARAGSAGVFIAYASHVLAMAPGTRMGAAHPVVLGIGGTVPRWEDGRLPRGMGLSSEEILNLKLLEDTAAWVRLIAQARGRSADWIEASVRRSAVLTAEEAHQQGIADLLARDQADLFRQLEGREVVLAGTPATLRLAGAQVVRPRIIDVTGLLLNAWAVSGGLTALLMVVGFLAWALDTMGVLELSLAADRWLKRSLFLAVVTWGGLGLYAWTRARVVLALPVAAYGIATLVWWLGARQRPAAQPAPSFWEEEKLAAGEAWQCPACRRINPDFVPICSKCGKGNALKRDTPH